MKKSQFIAAELENLDCMARQSRAIELFNQAMEDDDTATAIDVAICVIGDDEPCYDYAAGFQMHCLSWLARHHHRAYGESADESPEEDAAWEALLHTLWKFKWVVARLPYDINMTRDEITQANELMIDLYEHFLLGQAAVAKTLMHQSIKMGDIQAAKRHFTDWQQGENDFADCPACERDSLIQYHHFIGDYQAAVDLAAPILSGELTCAEVPHMTYEFVIDSLLRLKQDERARELLNQAIDLIFENVQERLHLLPPLIYLASKAGQKHIAKDLLDDYNDDIIAFVPNNRLYYLDYLLAVAPFNDEGLIEAQKVAAQFDQRNGNSFYQDKLTLMFGNTMIH